MFEDPYILTHSASGSASSLKASREDYLLPQFATEHQSSTPEEEESLSSSVDDDDEEFDVQLKDLQLPPELLLQQAFTGRSAVVNMDQINAQASRQKGSSLRMLDYSQWQNVAEIEFPDLPLWFDNQVCTFFSATLNKIGSENNTFIFQRQDWRFHDHISNKAFVMHNLQPAYEASSDPATRPCLGSLIPDTLLSHGTITVFRATYWCGQKCTYPSQEMHMKIKSELQAQAHAVQQHKRASTGKGRPTKVHFTDM